MKNYRESNWTYVKKGPWVIPEEGMEGHIKIGYEPDKFGNQYYLCKDSEQSRVYVLTEISLTCTECPEGDRWKWKRSTNKNGWFTLQNKSNGLFLTAFDTGNLGLRGKHFKMKVFSLLLLILNSFFLDNESYYSNNLGHLWVDLRSKHCDIMKKIAIKNGGVPNQEHHGFKVSYFWQKKQFAGQFEACYGLGGKYECFICDTRFTLTSLTRPINGNSEMISKNPATIEGQGDKQKSPLSKIQKPYDFARGKINFSMEDLQNSSEGEDWDSDCSLPMSNSSPRIQPIRECK